VTQPETSVRKRPSRAVEIAVGAMVIAIAIALIGLAVFDLVVILPARRGLSTWVIIAGLLLLASFLALTGASFVRGARGEAAEALSPGQVRRWPFLAGTLSLLAPGLGQLYNGQWGKAAAFYLGTGLLGVLWLSGLTGRFFWGFVLTVATVLALQIWAIVDSMVVAWRSRVSPRHRFASCWLLGSAVVALVVLPRVLLPLAVVKSYFIQSGAMAPTLPAGDQVFAELGYYDDHPLAVGEIVIFRSLENPAEELVKRVVALPGDRVEIRDKALYVNDKPVHEPWAVHRDVPRPFSLNPKLRLRDNLSPLVVPKDAFFVLGDNRDFAYDSRFFGPVPIENLRGKVLFVHWSADRSRIGRTL